MRSWLPAHLVRVAARVVLVALSVGAIGPLLHGAHQDACEPLFVLHDASDHRVSAPPAPAAAGADDHCVACHFARASRGPVSWEISGLLALDAGDRLTLSHVAPPVRPAASPRPARAPPLV